MKNIKSIKIKLFAFIGMMALLTACTDDMNVFPKDDDEFTSEDFYAEPSSYKQFLAKVYGGLAVTGQVGPSGNADIQNIDEGFGQYLRGYWQLQELSTDEAMVSWGDPTLPELNTHTWTKDNRFVRAFYSRVFYQIALANEFLRETTEDKLSSRGVTTELKADVKAFRAEVRFLRALSYYHGIDLFGKVPFATEDDKVGVKPQEKDRVFVYDFLVKELKEIDADLKAARTNEYGRVDKIGAKMLLAKLYLNSLVFTNVNRDTEALAVINEIIASPYKIASVPYSNLFMADNNRVAVQNEIIFPILFDGLQTKTWGGTTFLVHAPCGDWNAELGIDGGWFGLVGRKEFAAIFPDLTGLADQRAVFNAVQGPLSISKPSDFFASSGLKIRKWTNTTSTGAKASNETHPDTDFPMFRLADVYLMYAELAAKGVAGASTATAKDYVNALRIRAKAAQVTAADITSQFVLNERAKELYWEGHRRQDLIRFGKYAGSSYNWEWKGNVQAGTSIDDKYKLFPIPQSEINTNPNLTQNTGY
jgi:starch-binding outer membrane protein, SusD/RagB family